MKPTRTTGSLRRWRRWWWCCSAQPVKEAVQNALDRVFYRDRYDYRRAPRRLRPRSEQRPRRHSSQPAARHSRRRNAGGRPGMALMLADERLGDFRSIGDFGFASLRRNSRARRRSWRGSTPATPLRSTTRSLPRGSPRRKSVLRDHGIYYFVPCVFEGAAIRRARTWPQKNRTSRFNSEDLALLTAVAGQVATAIENGRLFRQLHMKAGTRPHARVQREHP